MRVSWDQPMVLIAGARSTALHLNKAILFLELTHQATVEESFVVSLWML